MNIFEFTNKIIDIINEDENLNAEVITANGKSALIIKEKDEQVTPVIYLDKMFDTFSNVKEEDMPSLVKEILKANKEGKLNAPTLDFDITKWDEVKTKIYSRMASVYDKSHNNKTLILKDYTGYFDLIFYINMGENYRIRISKDLFDKWEVTEDDIKFASEVNNMKFGEIRIEPLGDLISEMIGTEAIEGSEETSTVYVVYDNNNITGASLITDEVYRNFIANYIQNSYYIIPSSIHELLIIPDVDMTDEYLNYMKNMVKEINDTIVDETKRLSYEIYHYDRFNNILIEV